MTHPIQFPVPHYLLLHYKKIFILKFVPKAISCHTQLWHQNNLSQKIPHIRLPIIPPGLFPVYIPIRLIAFAIFRH
jgi:hypothetical protein